MTCVIAFVRCRGEWRVRHDSSPKIPSHSRRCSDGNSVDVFCRSPAVVAGGGAHRRRVCFVGVLTEGGFGSVCFVVLLWSSDGREWRGVYAGAPCGKLNAEPFLEGMILVGGYSNVGRLR